MCIHVPGFLLLVVVVLFFFVFLFSFFIFLVFFFFFFKQKTAYEIYQCDWSSDVCSSDLGIEYDEDWSSATWKNERLRDFSGRISSNAASWAESACEERAISLEIGRASCRERV